LNVRRALPVAALIVLLLTAAWGYAATYEGVGRGYAGDMVVAVELDGNVIVSVEVIEHSETPILSDAAIDAIPNRIVEAQSVDVDMVSGATQTSQGILAAVSDALDQAGVSLEQLGVEAAPEPDEAEIMSADVVIVGAGGAGLGAAIESAAHGAEVILLEKLSFAGGETLISAGGLQAGGSSVQEEAGIEDSAQELFRYWMEKSYFRLDSDWTSTIAKESAYNIEWLREYGVEFAVDGLVHGSWNPNDPKRFHMPVGGGSGLVEPLVESAENLGVQIIYDTKATELIQENGRIVGVLADGQVSEVRANAVILATGGFGNNPDLIAEYAPEFADAEPVTTPGNTGSGLLMAKEAGAKTADIFHAIGWQVSPLNLPETVLVNREGHRFIDENAFYSLKAEAMIKAGGTVYQIFDSPWLAGQNEDTQAAVADAAAEGELWKADTLQELGNAAGIDGESLAESMDEFSAMAEAGEDTQFFRAGDTLVPVAEGPFYAMPINLSHLGTIGGVAINNKAQVVDAYDQAIPGLYAAGSVTGGLIGEVYPGSGTAIATLFATARIAAEHAIQE